LDQKLRGLEVPVIGRTQHDRLLLDPRTMLSGDAARVAAALDEVFGEGGMA